jgi:hypothetical protein
MQTISISEVILFSMLGYEVRIVKPEIVQLNLN